MKSLHNKKGIELSINFLVVIILSLVMLTLGIYLIREFFTTTEEIKVSIDQSTEAELTNLLEEGQLVAVAFNRKEIKPGGQAIYGIGIYNALNTETTFTIPIELTTAVDRNNMPITVDTTGWVRYENSITILPNEQEHIPILIKVGNQAQKGTYVFTARVMANSQLYGVGKIYVVV